MVEVSLMHSLVPVILISIAFVLGLWFTFWPLSVLYTFSTLTIWLVEHFFRDKSTMLKNLRDARHLLDQDIEQFKYNLQWARITGIVILVVGITWVWIFYG